MTDPQFTVAQHAGQHIGETLAAEPDDVLEAQAAAHAIALGAEAVAHETPLGPIAGQVPGAAAQLQAAVQAGVVQAQNTPSYLTATPAASATASTYDDKPEQTSALVTPDVDAAPVEEAKPDPAPTPEPAHEPEATHPEPPPHDADPGADDAA